MKSLLDKDFRYVPSHDTNVAETFKRVRAEQEKARTETEKVVKPLIRGKISGR